VSHGCEVRDARVLAIAPCYALIVTMVAGLAVGGCCAAVHVLTAQLVTTRIAGERNQMLVLGAIIIPAAMLATGISG
jgi:hypothetical protein